MTDHRYSPRGTASELLKNRGSEVLLSGPAGTGKSRACLEKLHLMALLNPGMKALIVRKTFASLGSTALQTYRRFVAKETIAANQVKFHGGGPQDAPQYRYKNGSTITLGGMDKATRIMSSEYDIIYVQEAIELTENDWEALTTRLRAWTISFQQIIADTNPDKPKHWLKIRANQGKLTILESRHEDNPQLFNDFGVMTESGKAYLDKLESLSGVRYARLRKGLWVAAEGLVYENEYDSAIHLIDRFDIPWEWPRYWSVDFGYKNPFVCQFWAQDPDGRLYLYKEFYRTNKIVDWHAKAILSELESNPQPRPRRVVCDHDAEGRATFESVMGLATIAANKAVSKGIQAVQKRMNPLQDGGSRLFILRDSLVSRDTELDESKRPACTEEEITGYIWDTTSDKAKEVPVKENDHGMDAMRYVVASIDVTSRPNVRWLG